MAQHSIASSYHGPQRSCNYNNMIHTYTEQRSQHFHFPCNMWTSSVTLIKNHFHYRCPAVDILHIGLSLWDTWSKQAPLRVRGYCFTLPLTHCCTKIVLSGYLGNIAQFKPAVFEQPAQAAVYLGKAAGNDFSSKGLPWKEGKWEKDMYKKTFIKM